MKNYGYVPSKIDYTHYQFGASSLPKDILQYDRNWKPYLPSFENQAINFDTFGCVPFGTTNILETLLKKIFGGDYNYSERFLYNLLRVVPPVGSDPHTCAEYIRTNGAIDDSLLPMTSTLTEYSMPRPVTPQYLAKGTEWLAQHSFGHEWVWTNNVPRNQRVALMNEALQYSPLGITVTAWYQDNGNGYVDNGQPNTHWVECYALDGDSPLIFDSYAQDGSPFKKLDPDHHIEMCKRYYIGLSTNKQVNYSWIGGIIRAIMETLGLIQKEMPTQPITPPQEPVLPPSLPVQPKPAPISPLDFSIPILARHSVKVICDQEGLSLKDKNEMCATIQAESNFNTHAKNENKVNGKVVSTDWGICQWNDYYHGTEITPDEAVNNPEKAVRLMCAYWKRGQGNLWVGYSSGNYKKYLSLT